MLNSFTAEAPHRCAVVDADAAGRFLPAALGWYGTQCVHVRSSHPDIHLPGDQHGIETEVRHHGDIAETAAALRRLGVDYVIAGAESGVELADLLADRLGWPGNGMRTPRARRNKYQMAEAVRRAGLAASDVCLSAWASDLVAWAVGRDEWPVVLKPAESAGADNVTFCHNAEEVRAAHRTITTSADRYGRRNQTVLGQQFLAGDEYFVNTVSRAGLHHVGEIWRYRKRWVDGNRPVYDYEYPVPADDPDAAAVGRYALGVLDALEISNGAAHAEVMLTEAGPVLVECNARLCGSMLPQIVSRCLGTNQVELLALSIAAPDEFARLAGTGYRLATHLRYVSLISPRPGIVPSHAELAPVRALPSFAEMAMTLPAGQPLPRTVDLLSSPGYVYLMCDDPGQLERDYRRLRELENTSLYAAPSAVPS